MVMDISLHAADIRENTVFPKIFLQEPEIIIVVGDRSAQKYDIASGKGGIDPVPERFTFFRKKKR